MDPKRYGALMLAVSIIYGSLVALLAVLDSGATTIVAIAGGALVALGWALYGSVVRRPG